MLGRTSSAAGSQDALVGITCKSLDGRVTHHNNLGVAISLNGEGVNGIVLQSLSHDIKDIIWKASAIFMMRWQE
eukprot:4446107-Ditylum_brightwellii.AAC.1